MAPGYFTTRACILPSARELRPNSWYHYRQQDVDELLKIKLAAIIKHNGNHIFVNREGMKVISCNVRQVAELMRAGQLTMIQDGDHRLSRPQDIARILAAVAEMG